MNCCVLFVQHVPVGGMMTVKGAAIMGNGLKKSGQLIPMFANSGVMVKMEPKAMLFTPPHPPPHPPPPPPHTHTHTHTHTH